MPEIEATNEFLQVLSCNDTRKKWTKKKQRRRSLKSIFRSLFNPKYRLFAIHTTAVMEHPTRIAICSMLLCSWRHKKNVFTIYVLFTCEAKIHKSWHDWFKAWLVWVYIGQVSYRWQREQRTTTNTFSIRLAFPHSPFSMAKTINYLIVDILYSEAPSYAECLCIDHTLILLYGHFTRTDTTKYCHGQWIIA